MTMNNENESKYLTLDIPQREGKDGYIGTLFGLYLKFGGIISDIGFKENDVRIYYMTKFLINLIPGKRNRAEIKEKMKNEIAEAMKNCSSNDERMRIRNDICLDYIGDVHDFVDKHVGVSKENKIGFSVRQK